MSCVETRSALRLPSAVKFSRMTATTRLMKTKVATIVYEMKYGSARREPQSPLPPLAEGSQPRASLIMQSYMKADQPSPVMHWKRSSMALPKLSKLRSSEMFSWCCTRQKRFMPSTA